jgi:hypothetical protein
MTPPHGSTPRLQKPRSASPAERSEEFAEAQRQLKREAAERRDRASQERRPPRPSGKPRGRA